MAICAVPDSVATASVGHGTCTLTQSQASYHSASPGPSARRPSSCFDDDTEEANVCANFDVAVEHAHARASAVTTDDDNDDDANVVNFTDILGEIFDAPFMASSVLDLDLAFGAADSNVDFDGTTLLYPLSPLYPGLHSPLLLLLLLPGSPPEIQEFSIS